MASPTWRTPNPQQPTPASDCNIQGIIYSTTIQRPGSCLLHFRRAAAFRGPVINSHENGRTDLNQNAKMKMCVFPPEGDLLIFACKKKTPPRHFRESRHFRDRFKNTNDKTSSAYKKIRFFKNEILNNAAKLQVDKDAFNSL